MLLSKREDYVVQVAQLANINNHCFHPVTNICQESGKDGVLAVTGGSECACADRYSCLDSIGIKCIKARTGKIIDPDDKKVCRESCSDTNKCYDKNFICRTPNYYNVRNDSTGGACTEFCTDNNKCFSPISYQCKSILDLNDNYYINTLGIECECKNDDYCYTSKDTCSLKLNNNDCLDFYSYQLIWFVNHDSYQCSNNTYRVHKIGSIISSEKILVGMDDANDDGVPDGFVSLVTGVTDGKPTFAKDFIYKDYQYIIYKKTFSENYRHCFY